jgi:hypothetical protein
MMRMTHVITRATLPHVATGVTLELSSQQAVATNYATPVISALIPYV